MNNMLYTIELSAEDDIFGFSDLNNCNQKISLVSYQNFSNLGINFEPLDLPLFGASNISEFDGTVQFDLLDMTKPLSPVEDEEKPIQTSNFEIKFENFNFEISVSTTTDTPIGDNMELNTSKYSTITGPIT